MSWASALGRGLTVQLNTACTFSFTLK